MKDMLDLARPSIAISYLQVLVEVVGERGVAQAQLLDGLPIAPASLKETGARMSPIQWGLAVARAIQLCDDPGLGYECGLHMRPSANGFLGYAVMSCGSMREAMELAARYIESRQRHFSMRVTVAGRDAVIELREKQPIPALRAFFFEHILVGLARSAATILGRELTQMEGLEIGFDWPQPAYHAAYRKRLPPVRFSRSANQLRFPARMLELKPVLADPQASKQAIELCERELTQLGGAGDSVGQRVLAHLVQSTRGGYPQLGAVAARLHMSGRTLARKLADEGRSFQKLLDEARRRDACELIERGALPMQDIAAQLGYNNPANFTRAFQRWTGLSPTRWRERASLKGD